MNDVMLIEYGIDHGRCRFLLIEFIARMIYLTDTRPDCESPVWGNAERKSIGRELNRVTIHPHGMINDRTPVQDGRRHVAENGSRCGMDIQWVLVSTIPNHSHKRVRGTSAFRTARHSSSSSTSSLHEDAVTPVSLNRMGDTRSNAQADPARSLQSGVLSGRRKYRIGIFKDRGFKRRRFLRFLQVA